MNIWINRSGEQRQLSRGLMATIVEYRDAMDISVAIDADEGETFNCSYNDFLCGRIASQDKLNELSRLKLCKKNVASGDLDIRNGSGYKGVSWHRNKWVARIYVDGKYLHLGTYTTPEQASGAYVKAYMKYKVG